MGKKKTAEPIVGTGKNPENKLTVQKSIPLFSLWQSDMSLPELKILDTYLSRINSHEPEKRTVIFTKGELEGLLGVKKINKPQLSARLKSLGRFVDIEDTNTHKIHQIALFEEAYGEMDKNGQWTVNLTCTEKAMKYIFNIEKLGYLRYKLHSIVSLKSRYAYVLFLYLEYNRFRKSWEEDVNDLRKFFNCTEELYDEFKYFNQRVLRRCQEELTEKTECRFTYEPVKKGRRVTSIRFTVETLSDAIGAEIQGEDPDQITIFDAEDSENNDYTLSERREAICHGFGHKLFAEFSDEELAELRSLAWSLADPDVEARHFAMLHDFKMAHENAVAEYIRSKILAMNVYSRRHPINNRYSYLKKSLVND